MDWRRPARAPALSAQQPTRSPAYFDVTTNIIIITILQTTTSLAESTNINTVFVVVVRVIGWGGIGKGEIEVGRVRLGYRTSIT